MIEITSTRSPPTDLAISPQTLVDATTVRPVNGASVGSATSGEDPITAQPESKRAVTVDRAKAFIFISPTIGLTDNDCQ
jgi:septal ring-binding cell division protein DamX